MNKIKTNRIDTQTIKEVLWFILIFAVLGIHLYTAILVCSRPEPTVERVEPSVTPLKSPVSKDTVRFMDLVIHYSEVSEEEIEVSDEVVEEKPIEESEPIRETLSTSSDDPDYSSIDIPLSADLQEYIFDTAKERGIDPYLVLAMIKKESGFRANVKGDGGESYGLMQIKLKYNHERMKKLGCSDLLNPYDNVRVGIDILEELSATGKPIEYVLMSYNGGPSYAKRKWAAGEISDYVKTVLQWRDEIKEIANAG